MHAPNPLAKTLGSWLLLMFALVMSSTAWAQRDEGQYQILQAVYGTDQSSIDVTDRLKQLAARDQRGQLGLERREKRTQLVAPQRARRQVPAHEAARVRHRRPQMHREHLHRPER